MCEACGLDFEITNHLLWDCQRARKTWELSRILFDITGIHYKDFKDLLWYLIFTKHVDKDLLALIVIVAWCMWFNRNKTRLGNPRQPSREIPHKARLILEEFQLAHLRKPHHQQAQDLHWVPPTSPYYKINTNAAILITQSASVL